MLELTNVADAFDSSDSVDVLDNLQGPGVREVVEREKARVVWSSSNA